MTFLQNSTINRKSFRHRKVDNKKPLRIYTPGEINEDDCIPVSRAGIEIETGVEKEEEEEWHLVNALKLRTESMEKGATASGKATIPVPTSSRRISYYADVYQTHKWKKPSTYVKFSLPVEECIGCLYCMDEKDDEWLADHKQKTNSTLTEDQFEEIMQHFENITKNKPQLLAKKQLPTWQDCECLPESLLGLKSEAEIVFTYWKTKRWERMKQYQKVGPLMFEIKTQEGKDEEDHPWTCFRRRELKPIRRTRRTETASFDKLRKIRKDIHAGRNLMTSVTAREKTKKQKIELDRKIFEKECTARELRKKLGIKNEISHEQQKRSRKSSYADLLGISKTKSGIKLSKKDDEFPMVDLTDFPYLVQQKPLAARYFRKFDSLKPTDRSSISCTAFRSRFGRGGRRRRIIDRIDVHSYRRLRETNERYRYDSDGLEDIFSDDELNPTDDEEDEVEDFTENIIRFHLFKEEDYQNLGVYRRIQKEKQLSPTKQQSLDALTGNNIPAQNPQHTPLANSESRQILEQRTINDPRFVSRSSLESRNIQKLDSDPRTNTDSRINIRNSGDSRTSGISNIDPRTYIIPNSFNSVDRIQNANTESSTNRDSRLNSNSSTPRLSSDSHIGSRIVNNIDSRAHNGLILRPTVTAMNHRDNMAPYRRPPSRNIRIDDSNNTIGVTTAASTPNGITGSNNTSMSAANSLAKNHVSVQNAPINSPVRSSSINNNSNGQVNGDGLARTSSNSRIIANGSQLSINSPGVQKILMNSAGQMIDSKIINNASLAYKRAFTPDHMKAMHRIAAQTSRQQNITVPSVVGSNVPLQQNIVGIIQQSPSTSVIGQNNIVQSNGSSGSVSQNFPFNISPTSGSSNVRQNILQSNGALRHIDVNQNVSIGVNTNESIGNNCMQTINVNSNVTIGNNGSQQAFVHPNGVNMSGVISTNGQSTMRATNLTRNYNLAQLNGLNPTRSVLQVANGGSNLRQVPNPATARFQSGFVNTVLSNGANFGLNSTQMRIRQQNNNIGLLNVNNFNYDLILPNQQNNVSPASISTSNGNNSVGTPSPQPQAEQRSVR